MRAMLGQQPVCDGLLIEEAGHVVDLATGAMALDLPTAPENLLGFKNYMGVYHPTPMRPRLA
jgi:hypothetical protein